MKRILLAALLAGALGVPLCAQAPAPGHARAAEELLQLMNMQAQLRQGVEMNLQAQLEANPALRQFEGVMRDFLSRHLSWNALREELVRLYAETFTERELRGLLSFYRTPLGAKVLASTPQLMSELGAQTRLEP